MKRAIFILAVCAVLLSVPASAYSLYSAGKTDDGRLYKKYCEIAGDSVGSKVNEITGEIIEIPEADVIEAVPLSEDEHETKEFSLQDAANYLTQVRDRINRRLERKAIERTTAIVEFPTPHYLPAWLDVLLWLSL